MAALNDHLMAEFDAEMAATRKVLERVPEGKADYRPHPKSAPLGRLATHVAQLPGWVTQTLTKTELDISPPPGGFAGMVQSPAGNLDTFDTEVAAAKTAIAAVTDRDLDVPWTLKMGVVPLFTMSRREVYRRMVMNHLVHHRAQLGVYLRLLGIPLPGIYGPTADETPGPPKP